MSTLKVNTIGNKGSAVDFPNKLTVRGNAIEQGYTASGTEPSSPSEGDIWWDSTNSALYQYINSEFKTISLAAAGIAWGGTRGITGGGLLSGQTSTNVINYVTIATPSNAVDFGDLSVGRETLGALSNGTRGLFGGGAVDTSGGRSNVIDYITIGTLGNATDFGDLQYQTRFADGASCNGTIGIFAGGYITSAISAIQKVVPATTGNATSFGVLSNNVYGTTSFADDTRGVIAGGYGSSADVTTEYITYATEGNATDFGDLDTGRYEMGSVSDATRGVVGGGQMNAGVSSGMDYFTTQTTGNSTDFGDLTVARKTSGMSNSTYGVFTSGTGSSYVNTMDYITVQTTANATDFGDNTAAYGTSAACSGT